MIIDTLAAYRLTRLLQKDSFPPAKAVRDWAEDRGGLLAEMFECPWCLGMWVSLGVAAVSHRRLTPGVVLRALAMSAGVGMLRELEEVLEELWDEHSKGVGV